MLDKAASAAFDAWREMERVEVSLDIASNDVPRHRDYGCENRNIRMGEPAEYPKVSQRVLRSLHIREIDEQVGDSVRIGGVNRFKI